MAPEISVASSFYVSAPTSPGHCFNNDDGIGVVSFYSVPVSPTKRTCMFNDTYDDVDADPTRTASSSSSDSDKDSSFNLDEFEFETSRRFNVDEYDFSEDELGNGEEVQQQQECYAKQRRESLPAMAFADELFCDGKVMPLKPPPGLHCVNDESFASHRTSPASPNSMLRIPFTRRSLWNDDFDPFMVALENVKEDKRGNHRRAKSMFATFPACMSEQSFNDDLFVSDNSKNECRKKYYSMPNPQNHFERPKNQSENEEQRNPIKLAEPKGVVFARRARLVKMVNELPKKSSPSAFPDLTVEARQSQFGKEIIGVTWSGQNTKRKKIKNFLFKTSSIKKGGDNYMQGEQYLEPKNPKMARKLSLMKSKVSVQTDKAKKVEEKRTDEIDDGMNLKNSKLNRKLRLKSVNSVECSEEEKVSEETEMITVVKHRPKLLLCMGVGSKYVK